MDTPAVICCRSTSNPEYVSPLQMYEQKRCPPTNVLRVNDMCSHWVLKSFPVRLLKPSLMACWWNQGYIFPVASWVPVKYWLEARAYGILVIGWPSTVKGEVRSGCKTTINKTAYCSRKVHLVYHLKSSNEIGSTSEDQAKNCQIPHRQLDLSRSCEYQ